MADEIPTDNSKRGQDGMLRELVAAYWFPLALAVALMLGWYAAAGKTFGLFLGGLVVATIVTPGVMLAEEGWFGRAVAWAGVVDAVLLAWLTPVIAGVISFGDWVEAMLVVVAYSAAIGGVASGLRSIRVSAVLAAALTTVAGLAWLTWPVWMAPWLTGENRETVAAWLVRGHPVFAINGVMLEAFDQPWAQMTIAYRLTNLGDDVGYKMPRSVWACAGTHSAIAMLLIAPQMLLAGRGNNRSAEADPTGSRA